MSGSQPCRYERASDGQYPARFMRRSRTGSNDTTSRQRNRPHARACNAKERADPLTVTTLHNFRGVPHEGPDAGELSLRFSGTITNRMVGRTATAVRKLSSVGLLADMRHASH